MRPLGTAAAAVLLTALASPAPAQVGPCSGGMQWGARPGGGAPAAWYGACGGPHPLILVYCDRGGPVLALDAPLDGFPEGSQVPAGISIDGTGYELVGTARQSELAGTTVPILDAPAGLVAALTRGSSGFVSLPGETFRFHLRGSGRALDRVAARCGP